MADKIFMTFGDQNSWGDIPLPEDAVTLDDLLRGDGNIIERMYADYFPVIRQLILNNSGIHEDAEDIFQETLMVVFRKGKYEGLRITCSLGTFLYSVARNLWLQKLRHRKIHERYEMNVAEPLPVTFDSDYLEEARRQLYAEYFNSLSPDCQKVLRMSLNQATLEEIADAMGYRGPNYAKTKKFNCKELLKKRIRKDPRYRNLFR